MLILSNITLGAIMELKIRKFMFLLCFFLNCSRSQSTPVKVYACTTPTNDIGHCIILKDCHPIYSILGNLSDTAKLKLKQYHCGYDSSGEHKVCCTNKPIVFTDDTENKGEHPNLELLPKDCGEATPIDRITNGEKASLYEFPWQVALKYASAKPYRCGGTLINKRYVLTAAHCITTRLKLVGVRIGEYNFDTEKDCIKLHKGEECAPPVQDFDITTKDAIVHANYKGNFLYDIALIRLPRDAEYNTAVTPICLPINEKFTPKVMRNLTVVGWGNTEKGNGSSTLLRVSVPYQENSVCGEAYKRLTKIQDSHLCAGGTEGKDSCGGDSGGPIMTPINDDRIVRTVQVGLVSFGPTQCGEEKVPGVYTRLTSYIDWILDNMKP